MNYRTLVITETTKNEINTELLFNVASARADGVDVLRLDFTETGDQKIDSRIKSTCLRIVRELKKRAAVEFYVMKDAFDKSTTEAIYLINRFPSLSDKVCEAGNNAVFLRLYPVKK